MNLDWLTSPPTDAPLITLVPMLALLAYAAVTDIRSRRIPNALVAILLLGGLGHSFWHGGLAGFGSAWLGLLLGFGLTFPAFVVRAVGGGDVKLLAGVGAWFGPLGVLSVFCISAIFGLVIILAQSARAGTLGRLFKNTALLIGQLINVRKIGVDHVADLGNHVATAETSRSVDKPLPYAVPVLLAVLTGLAWPLFV
ncbi:MAG: A24 family peptidase [Planctomycetota bacterium]